MRSQCLTDLIAGRKWIVRKSLSSAGTDRRSKMGSTAWVEQTFQQQKIRMNLVYGFRIKQKSQSEAKIIRNKKQAIQKQKTQDR